MSVKLAREMAASAWCQPMTEHIVMNFALAEEFARILNEVMSEPRLGLATTGELLFELRARAEIDGSINYRTVDIDSYKTQKGDKRETSNVRI